MRKPTLNEKITLKGALVSRGVPVSELVKAELPTFIHYWRMIFGTPITMLGSKKRWHKCGHYHQA